MLSLHDALKNSYKDKKTQKQEMKKYGYYRDKQLSNHNQQVYYKPEDKKLLVVGTGTHNLSDWGTDAYLATGKLKDTNRYKEFGGVLEKAKKKYGTNATVVGHSLSGALAQYAAGKNDKVITLDKGATIGQKTRDNETSYRSKGDVVSTFAQNTKSLGTNHHRNRFIGGLLGGIPGALIGSAVDAYKAHDIGNIKNEKIFV